MKLGFENTVDFQGIPFDLISYPCFDTMSENTNRLLIPKHHNMQKIDRWKGERKMHWVACVNPCTNPNYIEYNEDLQ